MASETRRSAAAIGEPQLSVFIPSFGEGGVDRMLVNIASGIARQGGRVDFITTHDAPYLGELDPRVRRIRFRATDDSGLATELERYVLAHTPQVLMSAKGRDDRIAIRVRQRQPACRTRFVIRVGTAVAGRSRAKVWLPWQRRRARLRLAALIAGADGILANGQAVADELAREAGYPRERIAIVPNPTVTERLYRLAGEPTGHPWLDAPAVPVILGIGGLRQQKDFSTLIRAFARVRSERECRLVILGDGRQRRRLRRLAQRLRVQQDVDLAGFTPNPYAYLARSSLFVLSSLWEGLPNVLIEALAVGTPVVATDAPGAAAEILEGGRYGPLVPPRDHRAMAQAMTGVLDDPLPAAYLRQAAQRYTLDTATRAYLQALKISADPGQAASPAAP